VKEAGIDDVGEQVTGARTALTFTNCAEKVFVRPLGEVFLRGNFHDNFSSAESPRNAYTFLFREKPSRVFLLLFAQRVFSRTVRADCSSSRHVRVIWRRGTGARSVVFGPKCAVGKSGARHIVRLIF
jgi:hypothetical protein